jgi:hypothetical protein
MDTFAVKLDRLITEDKLAEAWGLKPEQLRRCLREQGAPHYRIQKGVVLYDGDELFDWLVENRRVVRELV